MNIIILFQKMKLLTLIMPFVCLVQFTKSSKLDVLRFVCDIKDGMSEDVTINTLPCYCTAVATSQNNEDVVKNMSAIKTTTIPFIQYFNELGYDDWDDQLADVQPFIMGMKQDKLDGIIFDRLFQDDVENYDVAKNRKIFTFFQNLKAAAPDALFGLALPKQPGIVPNAFDYKTLDEVIDFYVIQTTHYIDCEHDIFMKEVSSIDDMEKSLKALQQAITLEKVLLTIQVYSIGITSTLSLAEHGEVLITYSDMCHYKGKELSEDRKYCKDSIKSLYKKGRLVPDYQMLGAYIEFIDYDDFAGCCRCKDDTGNDKFPGTAAIVAGMDPNGTKPVDCETFGDYKATAPNSSEED